MAYVSNDKKLNFKIKIKLEMLEKLEQKQNYNKNLKNIIFFSASHIVIRR